MATNSAAGITWNLSDLFADYDDPKIATTLDECDAGAELFARRFRPSMEIPEKLTPDTLRQALEALEIIYGALGLSLIHI